MEGSGCSVPPASLAAPCTASEGAAVGRGKDVWGGGKWACDGLAGGGMEGAGCEGEA